MLTTDDLVAALGAIPVRAPVRAEEVTASTNATAFQLAEAGSPEWTLVSAAHQTEGRGRLDRSWTDAPGRALLFSFVLRPAIAAARAGLLPLLAGACMAEAIRATTGRRAACKWPNDLLLQDHKVGGILVESRVVDDQLRFVVVGVGVNLAPPPDVSGAGGIGETVGPRALLSEFLVRFASVYTTQDASLEERVRHAWLPVSATVGQLVEATTLGGRDVTGRAVGIDDFGSLVLSTDAGEVRVGFGDVEHLRPVEGFAPQPDAR
jgi:BirA family transcriptional regulator, biotin operon repressor / biotin---[acetyl-CoA-carboxylase] ligase